MKIITCILLIIWIKTKYIELARWSLNLIDEIDFICNWLYAWNEYHGWKLTRSLKLKSLMKFHRRMKLTHKEENLLTHELYQWMELHSWMKYSTQIEFTTCMQSYIWRNLHKWMNIKFMNQNWQYGCWNFPYELNSIIWMKVTSVDTTSSMR